jgi:hypothetical protein
MASISSPLRNLANLVSPRGKSMLGGANENKENSSSNPGGGKTSKMAQFKKSKSADAAPIAFSPAVYASPSGDQLKQINGENGKLRELNKRLIGELKNARLCTKVREAAHTLHPVDA